MFKSTKLRCAIIVATAAILVVGREKAPEHQGEGLTMEFVRIPAGSFRMGSPDSEKDRILFDSPIREVQITKPFYMGKYEVT
jgi:formylglycine-generating enzyme required for sulfatase activity